MEIIVFLNNEDNLEFIEGNNNLFNVETFFRVAKKYTQRLKWLYGSYKNDLMSVCHALKTIFDLLYYIELGKYFNCQHLLYYFSFGLIINK